MVFRCGAPRQHRLLRARCICDRGWIVSCNCQSLIPTFALLDIATTKVRRLGCCSHLLGSNMLNMLGMYVSPLVSGVTSNLSAVTSGVPRLDGLRPGSSCGCSKQFCLSIVTASHLFVGSGYCCPHPVLDDLAMLLCMSQTALRKVVVLTFYTIRSSAGINTSSLVSPLMAKVDANFVYRFRRCSCHF